MKFTVIATGGGTLTYKWQRDDVDLTPLPEGMSGETTDTLQIDNVKKKHEGTYTCIVNNAAGPTPSNPAQLTVCKFLYVRCTSNSKFCTFLSFVLVKRKHGCGRS